MAQFEINNHIIVCPVCSHRDFNILKDGIFECRGCRTNYKLDIKFEMLKKKGD